MNIAELTKSLRGYVEKAQTDLEEILREPVKEYLEATVADRDWLAHIMHTAGSDVDEAMHMSRALEGMAVDDLAEAVTKRLAGGVVTTTLVPAVLPTPLLTATNQAILATVRESQDEG